MQVVKGSVRGILSMGSWAFFQEPHVGYSRFLSCSCCYCVSGDKANIDKCLNKSTVGVWTRQEIISKIPIDSSSNRPNNIYNVPPPKKRQKRNE